MKPLRLIVFLLAVALMAAPALAQQSDQGAMGNQGSMSDQGAMSDPGAGGHAKMQHVSGKISAIDQTNNTLQVSGETLKVTDKTKFKGTSGLSSLKEGDQIHAAYKMVKAGENMATRIELMPPSSEAPAGGGAGGMEQAPSSGTPSGGGGMAPQGGSSSSH